VHELTAVDQALQFSDLQIARLCATQWFVEQEPCCRMQGKCAMPL